MAEQYRGHGHHPALAGWARGPCATPAGLDGRWEDKFGTAEQHEPAVKLTCTTQSQTFGRGAADVDELPPQLTAQTQRMDERRRRPTIEGPQILEDTCKATLVISLRNCKVAAHDEHDVADGRAGDHGRMTTSPRWQVSRSLYLLPSLCAQGPLFPVIAAIIVLGRRPTSSDAQQRPSARLPYCAVLRLRFPILHSLLHPEIPRFDLALILGHLIAQVQHP
eukprot:scaffold253315_cov35-Tisochrysis_lutea.AAC.2